MTTYGPRIWQIYCQKIITDKLENIKIRDFQVKFVIVSFPKLPYTLGNPIQ